MKPIQCLELALEDPLAQKSVDSPNLLSNLTKGKLTVDGDLNVYIDGLRKLPDSPDSYLNALRQTELELAFSPEKLEVKIPVSTLIQCSIPGHEHGTVLYGIRLEKIVGDTRVKQVCRFSIRHENEFKKERNDLVGVRTFTNIRTPTNGKHYFQSIHLGDIFDRPKWLNAAPDSCFTHLELEKARQILHSSTREQPVETTESEKKDMYPNLISYYYHQHKDELGAKDVSLGPMLSADQTNTVYGKMRADINQFAKTATLVLPPSKDDKLVFELTCAAPDKPSFQLVVLYLTLFHVTI